MPRAGFVLRSTCSLFLLVRGLIGVAGAKSATATCSINSQGTVVTREATSPIKRKARIFLDERETVDQSTGGETFASVVRRGGRSILDTTYSYGGDGSLDISRKLGKGFKGIGAIDYASQGGTVSITVDGRRVSLPALLGSPPTLAFEDGQPPPRLRVARSVVQILKKVAKRKTLAVTSCTSASVGPTPADVSNPFEDECETCFTKCWAIATLCTLATVGSTEILGIVDSDASCGGQLQKCGDLCNAPGHECCRFHCGDACCGRDATAEDTVCAAANAEFAGQCCGRDSVCGDFVPGVHEHNFCCPTGLAVCADPKYGTCCDLATSSKCGTTCCQNGIQKCADPTKNLCCLEDTGEGCGGACCPAGQRCVIPDDNVDLIVCQACPADKIGPVCGETCCAGGELCGNNLKCCRAENTCVGDCCDAQYCLASGCCDPPSNICGSSCCPPLSQCCNGQCCTGSCIGGLCCTPERSCGPTCCPVGFACTDAASGTCTPCPSGQHGCAPGFGDPTCCPDGSDCCASGECCAAPTQCCQTGAGPACVTPDQCVH